MAERRRAESVVLSKPNGSSSFTHVDLDSSLHPSPSPAASPKHGATPVLSSDASSPRSAAMKRASIVDGLTREELLMQHRRSLAGLLPEPAVDGASEDAAMAVANLEGVTLSRRHQFTKQQYDAGQQAEVYQQLDAFRAGFDEDEGAAGQA